MLESRKTPPDDITTKTPRVTFSQLLRSPFLFLSIRYILCRHPACWKLMGTAQLYPFWYIFYQDIWRRRRWRGKRQLPRKPKGTKLSYSTMWSNSTNQVWELRVFMHLMAYENQNKRNVAIHKWTRNLVLYYWEFQLLIWMIVLFSIFLYLVSYT